MGGDGSPIVEEPITLEERFGIAETCVAKMALEDLPTLIDDMSDGTCAAYDAAPDRLYLVGTDGRVAYRGGPGPFGFSPDELEAAIREELTRH